MMKSKNKFILFLLLLILFYSPFSLAQNFETLYNLNKQKKYFEFREKIKNYSNPATPWQPIFLQAIGDNVFGNFEESNNRFKIILDNHLGDIPDSVLKDIYEIKASNHINLFEYKKAYETALKLNSEYIDKIDLQEYEDLKNELIIWNALQNTPPQKIYKYGKVIIPFKRDEIGMWMVPVEIKNNTCSFVFDTGANFCVIMESLAKKFNFKIIDNAKFRVGTSTQLKVLAKIAVADRIKFGSIVFENVIFIVLPDEALDFGNYKIKGILGNPVARAFGEIIVNKNDELIIPEEIEKKDLKNLAFDAFTPVVQVFYGGDSLIFILDTGGQETCLYNLFFLKYKKEITSKYKASKIKIGGAGGVIEVDGYVIDKISFNSGDSKIELNSIKLITDKINGNNEYYYGHLGQDFFREFSQVKINYSNKYIEFIK